MKHVKNLNDEEMTEEQWKTTAKFLVTDGYRRVVIYADRLKAENGRLKISLSKLVTENDQMRNAIPKSVTDLLGENEKLYRIIQQLRERKK